MKKPPKKALLSIVLGLLFFLVFTSFSFAAENYGSNPNSWKKSGDKGEECVFALANIGGRELPFVEGRYTNDEQRSILEFLKADYLDNSSLRMIRLLNQMERVFSYGESPIGDYEQLKDTLTVLYLSLRNSPSPSRKLEQAHSILRLQFSEFFVRTAQFLRGNDPDLTSNDDAVLEGITLMEEIKSIIPGLENLETDQYFGRFGVIFGVNTEGFFRLQNPEINAYIDDLMLKSLEEIEIAQHGVDEEIPGDIAFVISSEAEHRSFTTKAAHAVVKKVEHLYEHSKNSKNKQFARKFLIQVFPERAELLRDELLAESKVLIELKKLFPEVEDIFNLETTVEEIAERIDPLLAHIEKKIISIDDFAELNGAIGYLFENGYSEAAVFITGAFYQVTSLAHFNDPIVRELLKHTAGRILKAVSQGDHKKLTEVQIERIIQAYNEYANDDFTIKYDIVDLLGDLIETAKEDGTLSGKFKRASMSFIQKYTTVQE